MTLYTQRDSNIRKSWVLIVFFLILVIGLAWLISYLTDNFAILIIAVVFSVFQAIISYWYSDKIVLAMTKAKPIEKKDNPELYRIVENLCIAAGLPMPRVYILDEAQPNAFATGRNPENAVVAVTTGLLNKLDRTELEGVVAHELAHIGNYDMRLGAITIVLVGIIAILSRIFLRMSFYGVGRRNSRGSGGALLLILGIAAAILTPIVATLIRLAISRKREFLADSTGALLTRYPEGLARALEKISQDPAPMRNLSETTSHLFISSPFKGKQSKNWLTKLFLTHPPAEERMKALRRSDRKMGI